MLLNERMLSGGEGKAAIGEFSVSLPVAFQGELERIWALRLLQAVSHNSIPPPASR